ncbi:hypothetical protein BGE01nite_02020 [Brevifollis gellanilyticus]|uniref:Uncharacterized protein n=1 Tax=Brevifollis gellanilyticus TaxID=748831 RepID=A0A512M3L7_9BACT|nr:hypothetical protein BGE01nite_02020 [Brevifollis gellanilyticus]
MEPKKDEIIKLCMCGCNKRVPRWRRYRRRHEAAFQDRTYTQLGDPGNPPVVKAIAEQIVEIMGWKDIPRFKQFFES